MKEEPKPLLTYDDVARRLGITRRHVSTLVAEGRIPVVRIGNRCVRFDPVDVTAYIEDAKRRHPRRRGRQP